MLQRHGHIMAQKPSLAHIYFLQFFVIHHNLKLKLAGLRGKVCYS